MQTQVMLASEASVGPWLLTRQKPMEEEIDVI